MSEEGLVNQNKADGMEPSSTRTHIKNDHNNPVEPTSQPTMKPGGRTEIVEEVDNFQDEEGKDVENGDYYYLHEQQGLVPPKRSHICCGCCCDTRTTVVVVNFINLGLSLFGIYAVILEAVTAGTGLPSGAPILIVLLGMSCDGLGLYGAWKFDRIATLICGCWFIADAILRIVYLNVPGFILCLGFSYPHFVFYNEIEKGIMTKENYDRERQCCTCCS